MSTLTSDEDCNGFLHGHLGNGFSSQMLPVGSPIPGAMGINPWDPLGPWVKSPFYGHFTKKMMDILDVVRS